MLCPNLASISVSEQLFTIFMLVFNLDFSTADLFALIHAVINKFNHYFNITRFYPDQPDPVLTEITRRGHGFLPLDTTVSHISHYHLRSSSHITTLLCFDLCKVRARF